MLGQDGYWLKTRLWANVTVYHDVHLETRLYYPVQGAVLGSDGFGYANDRGQWLNPTNGRRFVSAIGLK